MLSERSSDDPGADDIDCQARRSADSVPLVAPLAYGDEACSAAFVGGTVALARSRFDGEVRARVCGRTLDAIEPWREERGYRLPGEFVVVAARVRGD
ncbi:MAG: hypothetical protein ABI585_09900 [Betaproteobacteria bacterium]